MILPVRGGGRDRQQRKCPFARRKIRRGGLAKKGSRQGRKKSLCAFPTLRLCVNKNPRRRTRNAAGQAAKKRRRKENTSLRLCYSAPLREQKKTSRKEGESPRKKEIPLRLSYFSPLREEKNQSAIPSSSLSSNQDNSSSSNSPSIA